MEIRLDFKEIAEEIQLSSKCFLGEDAWCDVEVAVRNGLNTIMPIASAEILARTLIR